MIARTRDAAARADARVAWLFAAPALIVILLLALVPIAMTGWEALHGHDLRFPWLGRPFIGLANVAEAAADPRVRAAVAHTVLFALVSVPLELALGLAVALLMHTVVRGRGVIRVAALLPWAVPTVVAALIWRFMFDAQAGIAAAAARGIGLTASSFDWFVSPLAAWVPIVLADVCQRDHVRGIDNDFHTRTEGAALEPQLFDVLKEWADDGRQLNTRV